MSAITLINIVPVNKDYLVSLFDVVIFPAETALPVGNIDKNQIQ